jgi:integrase
MSGKSIAECAADQKPMSTVYAHRILTTKVPKEYAAEQARRKAARSFRSNGTTQLSEFIFHRGDGQQIQEFRKSWKTACTNAGCGNMHFHDLRRSAARDLIRSGVAQSVAMKITGHRTISIFNRYDITATEDVSRALEQTEKYRSA